jgi:acetylornithine deacetylase/succinyl-diaminopimelate desuccinylase-like protein
LPPDWPSVTIEVIAHEVVAHAQELIRLRTVNPPGDEGIVAQYLAAALARQGIESTLIETSPGRAAVRAVLHARAATARAVMLVAHMDTVGVEDSAWSVPPFAAEIRDGYLYGRGAIDDKGMLAVNLVTMLVLAREIAAGELTLTRDVVFLATPDEETGGAAGMEWLVRNAPQALQAEYAINEGGRVRVAPDGSRTLLLQVAEKSSHIVTITARGIAGHAGVPRADNAIIALGRALAAMGEFASDPANGVSPTILQAGFKSNVIPADATATLNVRTRPGESVDTVVAELRRLVANPAVEVRVTERGDEAPASSEQTPMYAAIAEAARAIDPDVTVTPYVSNGVTDSGRLRLLGVQAYGVLPFPLTLEDEGRMHGADERVPVDALAYGVRLIHGAVRRVAGSE